MQSRSLSSTDWKSVENMSDADTQMLLTCETLGNLSRMYLYTFARHTFSRKERTDSGIRQPSRLYGFGSAIENPGMNVTCNVQPS